MAVSASSLVLGTVQFGLRYGVANKTGQPDQATVNDIVQLAWQKGVREFDTAQDYGVSEEVLGKAFAYSGIQDEARVISKLDPGLDHCDAGLMQAALERSLKRLGVPRLFGLMLHKEDLLDRWDPGMKKIMRGFVRSGQVRHLGVSVYSPDRAWEALNTEGIDMVQVPSNILDRRFEKRGVFELAEKKQKLVYVRSVFLQGLILMEAGDLPAHMGSARPLLDQVQALCRRFGVTRHELALGYVKARLPRARVLVGVETPSQLNDDLASWEKPAAPGLVAAVEECFGQVDEKVLNPSLWGRV